MRSMFLALFVAACATATGAPFDGDLYSDGVSTELGRSVVLVHQCEDPDDSGELSRFEFEIPPRAISQVWLCEPHTSQEEPDVVREACTEYNREQLTFDGVMNMGCPEGARIEVRMLVLN